MADSLGDVLRTRVRALLSTARIGQFAGVGFVGATVDTLALFLLVEAAGLGPVVAKTIAWEIGIVVIFAINERWTFADYGTVGLRPLGRRFLRSNLVRFAGFLVTLSALAGLVYGFDVWYLAANVVGIGVGFFVNYTCESLYTWKVHRD
ncbi:GtrA family protein [Halosolutus gelatinilyticus]|uniref:GtrA family protein n=1 Tax=Halosolutus gelatinilyticus TaxID=2931975 RepID=UPI001FF1D887|nr:GtrA family protein [Halosolutus gelatinilyticus]